MKRELKFRMWDSGISKMEEVYALPLPNTAMDPSPNRFKVFMQYTGLKDKNGKEIYEGDIVKIEVRGGMYRNAEVKWHRYELGGAGEIPCYTASPMALVPKSIEFPVIEYAEVIGNIYETPEILK